MKLHIELPESIARERITSDSLMAAALAAQLDHTPHRPTIADRADWQRVDEILARARRPSRFRRMSDKLPLSRIPQILRGDFRAAEINS